MFEADCAAVLRGAPMKKSPGKIVYISAMAERNLSKLAHFIYIYFCCFILFYIYFIFA